MKTPYPRFAGIACRFLLTMLLFAPFAANAATTAITYQGKLVHDGEPVDGMVDLAFRLYDAEADGSQIGETVFANGVEVHEGVFTLQLEFGEGAFTGEDRWLEIDVNQTPLNPRQPLTPAPMAHFAHNAAQSHFAQSAASSQFAENAGSSDFAQSAGEIPGAAVFQQDGEAAVYLGPVRIGESDYPQSVQIEGRFASGRQNFAIGSRSFVAGGDDNQAIGGSSFAGAGVDNRAVGDGSFVGGGSLNSSWGSSSFVGGGESNRTRGFGSFIGGGAINLTEGTYAFIGGGRSNIASGLHSFVGGGGFNRAEGEDSFLGGGASNSASGQQSFVGGGTLNAASGQRSFVGGGCRNTASGTFSFAAGTRAQALHDGTFVWADDSEAMFFSSTGENQFLIRAMGGVGIGTAPTRDLHVKQGSGETTLPGIQIERNPSNAWALYVNEDGSLILAKNNETTAGFDASGSYFQLSDRTAKNSIEPLENVLDQVVQLRPSSYYLNGDEERLRRSIGFIAQDVELLFPEAVSEQDGRRGINYSQITVLNTAALIELNERYQQEIQQQEERIEALEERLARLESLLATEFAGR